jgi:hypothetical protein
MFRRDQCTVAMNWEATMTGALASLRPNVNAIFRRSYIQTTSLEHARRNIGAS